MVLDWPGVPRVILTPNIMEFKRLCQALVGGNYGSLTDWQKIDPNSDVDTLCPQLARALQNVTIVQKGSADIISNGLVITSELLGDGTQSEILKGEVEGGLKRVGGQGDILSGSVGVLLAWGSEWVRGSYE